MQREAGAIHWTLVRDFFSGGTATTASSRAPPHGWRILALATSPEQRRLLQLIAEVGPRYARSTCCCEPARGPPCRIDRQDDVERTYRGRPYALQRQGHPAMAMMDGRRQGCRCVQFVGRYFGEETLFQVARRGSGVGVSTRSTRRFVRTRSSVEEGDPSSEGFGALHELGVSKQPTPFAPAR